MWFGKKNTLATEKKNFAFRPKIGHLWTHTDGPGCKNFFFLFLCRSLQTKYFRRKNYKISLKIDKIIEFYRNHRNP